MTEQVTTRYLFDALREKLKLEWVAGESGDQAPISDNFPGVRHQTPVGHLNCIHPNRIQVIGHSELIYLAELTDVSYRETIDKLFSDKPAAILFSDGIEADKHFVEKAEHREIPLLRSPLEDRQLVNDLQYYVTHAIAERATIHGVFMEVMGVGVLLTGEASVGKSELALELLSRGHRLIADDTPEFAHIAPDTLVGTCPPVLREFLEVRGLGVLNVRAMFGDSAIKHEKYLRLIIHLKNMGDSELSEMDRLAGSHTRDMLLGVSIPKITVPVAPGRNLAILVETAVRQHILRLKGYDASKVFASRQRQVIDAVEHGR